MPAVQSTPRKRKRESAGGEGGGGAPASGPGETEEDPICLVCESGSERAQAGRGQCVSRVGHRTEGRLGDDGRAVGSWVLALEPSP